MFYLSFSQITRPLISKLKIANNLSKHLLTSINEAEKDKIIGRDIFVEIIKILANFQNPTNLSKSS